MTETPIVTINVEDTQQMHDYSQQRRKYSTPHQEEHSNHYSNSCTSSVNKIQTSNQFSSAHLLIKRKSSFGQAFNHGSKQQQTGQINGTQTTTTTTTSQHVPSVSSLQFLMGSSSLHPQNSINNSNNIKGLFGYLKGNKAISNANSNHSRITNHNAQDAYRDLLGKYYQQQQKNQQQQQQLNTLQQPFDECATITEGVNNDLDQDNISFLQQRQDQQQQKSPEQSLLQYAQACQNEQLEQQVSSELSKHKEQMQQLWSHSSYSSSFMDPVVESQLASSTKQLQRASFTNYQVDVTEQDNHTPLEYLKQFRIETGPPRSMQEQSKDINDNLEEYTEKLYFAIQERAAENLRKIGGLMQGGYGTNNNNNNAEENSSQGNNSNSQNNPVNSQAKQQIKLAVQSVLEYSESRTVVPRYAREGDWLCHCGNLNFSYRNICNKCQDTKGKFMLKKTSELSQQLDSIQKQLLCMDSRIMNENNNSQSQNNTNEVMVTQQRQIVLSDFIWICRCCRSVNYAKTVTCISCNMHKVLDAHRLMQISQHSQKKLKKYHDKMVQKRKELFNEQLLDQKNNEDMMNRYENDEIVKINDQEESIIDDQQQYPQMEIAIDNGTEEEFEQLDTDDEGKDDDEKRRHLSGEEQDPSTQENSISEGEYYYHNEGCHSQNDNNGYYGNNKESVRQENQDEDSEIEQINQQQMRIAKKSNQKIVQSNQRQVNLMKQKELSSNKKNNSKKQIGFGKTGFEGSEIIVVEDE